MCGHSLFFVSLLYSLFGHSDFVLCLFVCFHHPHSFHGPPSRGKVRVWSFFVLCFFLCFILCLFVSFFLSLTYKGEGVVIVRSFFLCFSLCLLVCFPHTHTGEGVVILVLFFLSFSASFFVCLFVSPTHTAPTFPQSGKVRVWSFWGSSFFATFFVCLFVSLNHKGKGVWSL